MKKKIFFSIFSLFFLLATATFYYLRQINKVAPYKVVNADKVKIRASPEAIDEDNVLGKLRLNKGDTVECQERTFQKAEVRDKKGNLIGKDYWYHIKTSRGIEGWAFGAYLEDATLNNSYSSVTTLVVKYIPPPPTLYRPSSNRNDDKSWTAKVGKWFAKKTGDRNTQELLSLIKACDYFNPAVRDTAVAIASKDKGSFNLGQVCNIYDYCLHGDWNYVSDPAGREYVAFASESLINGRVGDCDDYAVTIAAMITAIGGEILINYAYSSSGGHAFCEVNMGAEVSQEEIEEYLTARYGRDSFPGIRKDTQGNYWLDLDWFEKYPGSQPFPYYKGTAFSIIHETYYPLDRNLYR
jgi:hypothetical protein